MHAKFENSHSPSLSCGPQQGLCLTERINSILRDCPKHPSNNYFRSLVCLCQTAWKMLGGEHIILALMELDV